MIRTVFDILLYTYFVVVFVAALIGWGNRKRLPYPFNWLWVYLAADLLIELVVWVLRQYSLEFMWIYNLFGIVEYFFIAWLYYSYFRDRLVRRVLVISFVLYTLFVLIDTLFLRAYSDYQLVFLVRSMLMAGIALFYFLTIYRNDDLLHFNKSPLFWVSFGLFFFCTGSLFSMGLGSHMMLINRDLGYAMYLLNPILNIYLYVMFSWALLCNLRDPKFS